MEMMSPEESTELSPKLSAELCVVVVVVTPGNIDGQIAAPIAPIAIPTGKAMDSSCRVSLLRRSLLSTALFVAGGGEVGDGDDGWEGVEGVTMSRPISSAQTAASHLSPQSRRRRRRRRGGVILDALMSILR